MANKSRGEVDLKIGNEMITLRPTYQAQQHIEDALDERMLPLANRIANGDLGMKDVVVIVRCSIVKNGREWTDDEIGDVVAQAGLENVVLSIIEFVQNAVTGWQDNEKKSAERPAKKETASKPSGA